MEAESLDQGPDADLMQHETSGGTNKKPDIRELMGTIRSQVKAELAKEGRSRRPLQVYPAGQGNNSTFKAGDLLHGEELNAINRLYVFAPQLDLNKVQTHRRGPIAKMMVSFKRKILAVVWDYLLKDYFQAERDFNVQLVRHLNHLARYIDGRDGSNFWELIKKVDYDIGKAMRRIEEIQDEQSGSLRTTERNLHHELGEQLGRIERELSKLGATTSRQDADLKTLQSVCGGLESIIARIGSSSPGESPAVSGKEPAQPAASVPSYGYLLLENRFRGSEAGIRERLAIYPDVFSELRERSHEAPILEIGGGRGELQQLFREGGFRSYSVDIDAAMVEVSRAHGLDAELGDAVGHLAGLPPSSRSGVIAIQVVEHLTSDYLDALLRETERVLVPGGIAIFETINPRSLVALSSNYFRDPTHVFPLHPDTLSYRMSLSGFDIREVRMLSPIPKDHQLQELEVEPYMTPRWAHTVLSINQAFAQLNELLFGFQDFCVIAVKRG